LEIGLKPRNYLPLPINYRGYLENILYLFSNNRDDILDQLFYSDFICSNYEINGSHITFKDKIKWVLTSQNYDIISNLVQRFFNKHIIKMGKCEFEVIFIGLTENIELKSNSEFKMFNNFIKLDYEIA
jgi:CRISPR/Cas system endoribonuclease Cas6 (RAMP superfamily)